MPHVDVYLVDQRQSLSAIIGEPTSSPVTLDLTPLEVVYDDGVDSTLYPWDRVERVSTASGQRDYFVSQSS